jgi:hypothetical protein
MQINLFRLLCLSLLVFGLLPAGEARIKLVALPDRGKTVIRLDNPRATLIEEERSLPLQKGLNKIDFSWKGVSIDEDSIRLLPLGKPEDVVILNVSYPPGEEALLWEINSREAGEQPIRISYLLSNIDRLIAYRLMVDKPETKADLAGYVILRNFSGEDFERSVVSLGQGGPFEQQALSHEETRRILFLKAPAVPIKKTWTFDAARKPWDPAELDRNVGIPVFYEITNSRENNLGQFMLWGGKCRVHQDDGRATAIFLGEDEAQVVPVGEKMEIGVGESRDISVTQRLMEQRRVNLRKNTDERIILYDSDETISAKIENFKDKPAALTMLQHIRGQWEMAECNLKYERKDAETIRFLIDLPPQGRQELKMHYIRRNIRPGMENVSVCGKK